MENIFETLNINNQTLNTSHYKSVIDSLSISELSGNEFLISLPTNDESKFLQISFLILPSIASRHNCRTRSEVIFESRSHLLNFKNSFLQQTTNQIVVLIKERNNEIEEERDQLSIVGSIARSFPLFSRKSNNNNNNGSFLFLYFFLFLFILKIYFLFIFLFHFFIIFINYYVNYFYFKIYSN